MSGFQERSSLLGASVAAGLAALALAAAPALAAAGPNPPANDWPASPNTASSGPFAIVQMATLDAQGFAREWNKPGPHVDMHGTTAVRRGQPIDTFIAFRGCRADAAGRCNVTAAFELRGPDGKPQAHPPMEVLANQPRPPAGLIYLSHQSLGMTFTADDPVGAYIMRATVTDHVAAIALHTQQTLMVSR